MANTNKEVLPATLPQETKEEIRLTWQQLAETLSKDGKLELGGEKTLIIHQMDGSDFLSLVEEPEATERLKIFVEIMKRFSLELSFEGSVALGPFNLPDHSWNVTAGQNGFLRILAKPLTVRKSIGEIVSFLSKLPIGQALVLKPYQELFIEEIPSDAMFNYYQKCQQENDPVLREKGQDEMFMAGSSALKEKSLALKVYGLNAKQVDRAIDAGAGGILFKPEGSAELKEPRIVVGLVAKT